MNSQKTTKNELEDIKVSLKLKLAMLWASLMILGIYLDYLHLYIPSKITDIKTGSVFTLNITQGFLLFALASVAILALMIFYSSALPAKLNRWVNILLAAVYLPYMLFNLAGEVWMLMVYVAVIEVVLISLIFRYAWKWPPTEVAQ